MLRLPHVQRQAVIGLGQRGLTSAPRLGWGAGRLRARRVVSDELIEREHLGIDPAAVGLLVGEGVLDLVVEKHARLRGVDEQHLPGPQAAGDEHAGGVHVKHAHFARQDEPVIGGDVVPRGAQPVSVDGRARHAPV